MAAPKHIADAPLKIDEYIASMPDWSAGYANGFLIEAIDINKKEKK